MNFFTAGAKMAKEVDKRLRLCEAVGNDAITKEMIEEQVLNNNIRAMKYGCQLALAYKEVATEMGLLRGTSTNTFMITIRPECQKINLHTFKQDVNRYLERKMFKHIYICSYEQKGTSLDTLGYGYHVHIIAETTCRSKGEVLRNTISTFERYTASNCIQVDVCKNPESVKQDYLIDYKSQDGHKEITKKWDSLWRQKEGIACPIKSDEGTLIVELPDRPEPLTAKEREEIRLRRSRDSRPSY